MAAGPSAGVWPRRAQANASYPFWQLQTDGIGTVRDPRFRDLVLNTYGRQCAICGFQLRIGDALVGLNAAHIQWHQAGGPVVVQNGLALCCCTTSSSTAACS